MTQDSRYKTKCLFLGPGKEIDYMHIGATGWIAHIIECLQYPWSRKRERSQTALRNWQQRKWERPAWFTHQASEFQGKHLGVFLLWPEGGCVNYCVCSKEIPVCITIPVRVNSSDFSILQRFCVKTVHSLLTHALLWPKRMGWSLLVNQWRLRARSLSACGFLFLCWRRSRASVCRAWGFTACDFVWQCGFLVLIHRWMCTLLSGGGQVPCYACWP